MLVAITESWCEAFLLHLPLTETVTREDMFQLYLRMALSRSTTGHRPAANILTKELPRVPCVKDAGDFRDPFPLMQAWLGELHVGYERAVPYPASFDHGRP